MDDMVPELLEKIKVEYNKAMKGVRDSLDKVIQTGNYDNAYSYARDTAAALVQVFQDNITADILPDGRMYYNIANRILPEMFQTAYYDTVEAAAGIQSVVNETSGIGLKTQIPKFNTDRTRGIVDKVSEEEDFDKVNWLLKKPVVENVTQSAVDDTIKVNAEFQFQSGLGAKIIRKMMFDCCPWCKKMEGSYSYPDVPDDVYRRHDNCRCLVKYIPVKGGKAQDVWSKKWSDISTKNSNNNEEQLYKAVRGRQESFKDVRFGEIKTRQIVGTNAYVEDGVEIKPKALNNIRSDVRKAAKAFRCPMDESTKVVIFDGASRGLWGKYDFVNDIIYLSSELGNPEALKKMGVPNTAVNTAYHEYWHRVQAKRYSEKITEENKGKYIQWIKEKSRKRIEKIGITEYNVDKVSRYAAYNYNLGRFDEVEAEYMVSKLFRR